MPLSSPNQWRKYRYLFTVEFSKYVFHYLLFAKLQHLFARVVAIRFANSCIQQPQKIIDFCNRTNGRAGILSGSLLFDGNNRAKTGNLIYIRAFHVPHKLTGIRTKTFHIPALPFIVNRIESQRRFAAATHTRKHHQFILGDSDVNVFQVVFPCAKHLNIFYMFRCGFVYNRVHRRCLLCFCHNNLVESNVEQKP